MRKRGANPQGRLRADLLRCGRQVSLKIVNKENRSRCLSDKKLNCLARNEGGKMI